MSPHYKVIWKWSSIAWQMSVLSMGGRVQMLPSTVISRYSNTYTKKPKRLGIRVLPWAAENGHLHILEYLVERKYDQYRRSCVCVCGRERPLGLFEVLARNRQSAVELLGRTRAHENKPHRMCTIPPRQQLSSPTLLAIRTRNVIRLRGRRNTLALFYVFCSPFDGFFFKLHTISHEKKSRHPYAQKGALLMLLRKASLAKMRALTSLECSTSSVCSRDGVCQSSLSALLIALASFTSSSSSRCFRSLRRIIISFVVGRCPLFGLLQKRRRRLEIITTTTATTRAASERKFSLSIPRTRTQS